MNFNRFTNVPFCTLVALELHFGTLCGPFWPPKRPSWTSFGSSWAQVGLSLVPLGLLLAPLGAHLGARVHLLGVLMALLGSPGPNLPPLWHHGGQLSSKCDQFLPFGSGNVHLLVFSELRNARFNRENVCCLNASSCIYQ